MSKVFRVRDVDQSWLLPTSLHEFVPPGHMAHFVRDTVREALDLSTILDTYTQERGYPPYHPGMMVALLLYGYSRGEPPRGFVGPIRAGAASVSCCRSDPVRSRGGGRHQAEGQRLLSPGIWQAGLSVIRLAGFASFCRWIHMM